MNATIPHLQHLRSLLHSRFPTAMVRVASSDPEEVHSVEMALLPGKLVEIVSPANSPGGGLILWRLMTSIPTPLAFIDGSNSLEPASIDASVRQRLLWVRCHQAREAIRAADLLLRDGNLSTVLLDLRQLPAKDLLRQPSCIWHRLRILAERTHVSVAMVSPMPIIPCAARRWILQSDLHLQDLDIPADDLCPRVNPRLQRGIAQPSGQALV